MSFEKKVLAIMTVGNMATTVDTEGAHLYITQDCPSGGQEDLVSLDRNAQHALYLILKNRFED